jgi:hypothetical protein
MLTDPHEITVFVERLLKNVPLRKGGLTGVEKLVIGSILENTTYRQASIRYKYTESSFQNAASRLFKELSEVVGSPVNRRTFVGLIEKEWLAAKELASSGEIVFHRIQASLWIRAEKAQLVSIGYSANQVLDITNYLIQHSPQFEATFCLDVSSQNSTLELLWSLCTSLQISLPTPRNDQTALLKLVGNTLKQRSTLLVLRFDRLPEEADRFTRSSFAEILAAIGLIENSSCLLILDNEPTNDAEMKHTLSYHLRLAVEKLLLKRKTLAPRLVLIENDVQIVCDILQTYLK